MNVKSANHGNKAASCKQQHARSVKSKICGSRARASVVKVDSAELSLVGNREENQDRVSVISDTESLLLVAVDGMGGHTEGERAAEVTVAALKESFFDVPRPILDPQGFLTLALANAHDEVVELAPDVALDHKPRATCAICLVQDHSAYWGHIGDSRIYHLRNSVIYERTRDHSHVELLLREGLITEDEIKDHPMRNFVECCLGGDVPLPDMSISGRKRLSAGDVLLVCTDGFWSGLEDEDFTGTIGTGARPIEEVLRTLAEAALTNTAPYADNTSAAGLRWLG